jgi:hypothetical protein
MKFNLYFLIVGILSILFCITHALNGYMTVLPVIDASNFEISTKTTIFYIWHIISIENLIFGIVFLIIAFYKDSSKVKFGAFIIALIIFARWGVIFASILIKDIKNINGMLIDSIAIFIFIGLIILGIMKKYKIHS